MLTAIAATLKPGARLVLAFTPDTPQVPPRFRDCSYRFYTPAKMQELPANAGFINARCAFPELPARKVAVIAERG